MSTSEAKDNANGLPLEGMDLGVLTRVSVNLAVQMDSPKVHEHRARAYASDKGARVREVYRLNAVSGQSTINHPEVKRMLQDVRCGHIKGLIVSKLARLGRNVRELLEISDLFREWGAHLISLGENIDTSTPIGRVFFTIIAALAQWEREEIAKRIRDATETRAKMGRPINGQAVIGYQWKNKKLVPKRSEVGLRVRAYRLFAKLQRFRTVARHLYNEGFRTRAGKRISQGMVKKLIEDTTAIGLHKSRLTYCCVNKKRTLRPENEWIINHVPPIIGKELWTYCNDLVKNRKIKKRGPGRQSKYLFGNKVWCFCKKKMYVDTSGKWFRCECGNKIREPGLELIFLRETEKVFGDKVAVAARIAAISDMRTANENRIKQISAQISTHQKKIDQLLRLNREGFLTDKQFGERNKPIEEKIQKLNKERDLLAARENRPGAPTEAEVVQEALTLRDQWPMLDHEERKIIVESIVEKLVVHQATFCIHFHDEPSLCTITTKLRRFMAAQLCCHMQVICDKPGKPPKAPPTSICEKHADFIEALVKEGYSPIVIWKRLASDRKFVVSLTAVSRYVRRVQRVTFATGKPLFTKLSACDPYRKIIEEKILAGFSRGQIFDYLVSHHHYKAARWSVYRYVVKLRKCLGKKWLDVMAETNPFTAHRQFIEMKMRGGWIGRNIFRDLKVHKKCSGTYRQYWTVVKRIRHATLRAGTPIEPVTSVCSPFRKEIEKMMKAGLTGTEIFKALKDEHQFSGKQWSLYRFMSKLRCAASANGEPFPSLHTPCSPYRNEILKKVEAGLTARQIFKELQSEVGFKGTYGAVLKWVNKLKPSSD